MCKITDLLKQFLEKMDFGEEKLMNKFEVVKVIVELFNYC